MPKEGIGKGGELAPRRPVEKPDQPEVMKTDPSLGGDEQVSGVRVPVEDTEHEDLIEVSVDEILRQARAVGRDARIVDAPSAAALLDDDGLAGEIVDDLRDVDRGPIGKSGGKAPYVARLLAEIDLLPQVAPDLVDDAQRPVMPQSRHQRHGDPGQHHQRRHIAVDLPLDAGAAHLDDDLRPVMQAGRVNLRHGGRRKGFAVEMGKQLFDRASQTEFDLPDRLPCREGRDVILKRLQGRDVIVGQDIPTQAQRLAEFDECRAEPRKRETEPLRRLQPGTRRHEPPHYAAELKAQELQRDTQQSDHGRHGIRARSDLVIRSAE